MHPVRAARHAHQGSARGGRPASDLMFVGEAPGYHEDQQGRPFVGQAGRLLEQLLAAIGLTREQVFIANVLKSRPPNNRDPRPEEIAACQPYLWRQIELIRPKVVCTLGNHATKLLTGIPAGITRVHGRPQAMAITGHSLYLYPIFHPAAALYTPAMLTTLKEDFLRLPELLAHAAPQAGAAAPLAVDAPATPAGAPRPRGHPRRRAGDDARRRRSSRSSSASSRWSPSPSPRRRRHDGSRACWRGCCSRRRWSPSRATSAPGRRRWCALSCALAASAARSRARRSLGAELPRSATGRPCITSICIA